jgi:hypothetical protein
MNFIALTGVSAFANASYATQPPCATSDTTYSTACGSGALIDNSSSYDTAIGFNSLADNSCGNGNTASGALALVNNSSGSYNTANGFGALNQNVNGNGNVGIGFDALTSNEHGSFNTATGYDALSYNTTGTQNVATGAHSLEKNTAVGFNAATNNLSGSENTASGYYALFYSKGNDNTAEGYEAGYKLTTGSNNIEIGNKGAAADSKVIRIGTEGTQKKTFIAGIYGNSTVSGVAVVIGSNGELGAVSSSERFKSGIEPMGSNTAKLQQLRPVTFYYKADGEGTLRYGLIAEEVAKTYPELVVRDNKGRIDGVRYDELAPMLLNEAQKQAAEIRDLKQQPAGIQAARAKLQSKDKLVAQR